MILQDDFLALGPIIKARLRELLPAQAFVFDAPDLASVTEAQQSAPAVHVLYRGFSIQRPNPAWEEVEQQWDTIIVVRNVAGLPGASSEIDAGPLMARTVAALRPWVPAPDCSGPLHLSNPLRPAFKAGFGYYPIGWRVTLRVPTRPR